MSGRRSSTQIPCPSGDGGRLVRQDHLAEQASLSCPRCGETWPQSRWVELAELVGGAR